MPACAVVSEACLAIVTPATGVDVAVRVAVIVGVKVAVAVFVLTGVLVKVDVEV